MEGYFPFPTVASVLPLCDLPAWAVQSCGLVLCLY